MYRPKKTKLKASASAQKIWSKSKIREGCPNVPKWPQFQPCIKVNRERPFTYLRQTARWRRFCFPSPQQLSGCVQSIQRSLRQSTKVRAMYRRSLPGRSGITWLNFLGRKKQLELNKRF